MCQMRLWRKGCCYIDHYNVGWLKTPVSSFHWNIIYYILKRHFRSRLCVRTFYILKISVQPYTFFFQSTSQFCFGIGLPYYCSLSTILHMCYRCDILSTCVTHATARKQVFKTFWLPVEIIVDIILFWIYFANKMCFKFYYSVCFCYNETQCLHAVFALRIKEFISFLIVVCDILYIYDYHACFYVGECKCVTEIACIHLQRIWYVYAVSTITCM